MSFSYPILSYYNQCSNKNCWYMHIPQRNEVLVGCHRCRALRWFTEALFNSIDTKIADYVEKHKHEGGDPFVKPLEDSIGRKFRTV